jgi:hypothetical protein
VAAAVIQAVAAGMNHRLFQAVAAVVLTIQALTNQTLQAQEKATVR